MREDRMGALLAVGKGFALAAGITAAGILLTAALIVFVTVSDGALTAVNQAIKVASVIVGTLIAVRSYKKRGFALGACVGILYMVVGCALYYSLAGGSFTPASIAAEFAMGGLVGALSGALVSNLMAAKR